jgi:type IV secretion system protein VirD4
MPPLRGIAGNAGIGALVAIAGASVWVVSASALWSGGTGTPFSPLAWSDATKWWGANWWVNLWLVLAAAVPTIFLPMPLFWLCVLLCTRWRGRRPLAQSSGAGVRAVERGVTDNLGHAAWAARKQLDSRFSGPGCLIGATDRGGRLLYDDLSKGPTHSMIFAGPGSHKTTAAVTRIWTWQGPRVVFDPSCEIGPIMSDALAARGFRVTSIGLNGDGIDVVDWIDTQHPEADAHIRSVVDWIYNESATTPNGHGQHRDPFWPTWGRALVTCLAAHMLFTEQAGFRKTLAALRRGIATPEADMQDMLAYIHANSASRMASELAGGLMGMKAAQTFSGIYGNAFAATEWLSVDAYAAVVSGSAMRTADILDSDAVVFIQLPLRTLLATPAVSRAVMGALFNAMFHADAVGIEDRILFQIDEAWILGAMKEIKLCHTTARKYRGTISTIWQSEGQMEGVWGSDDAKLMHDTVSWRSYNAIQDGTVAEKLSRDLGEHAVLATSEGDNQGRQKPFGLRLPSSSKGTNVNVHEIKRRLIKGDEIMRAPADEMFVLARDFPHPIRCVSAPYFRYPDIARVMGASRFNTTAAE